MSTTAYEGRITYPASLPITERRDDLLAAIRDHQVVIVAGETGSGKSTQLPKLCLELGRGGAGLIGHTQPRRVAARTIAERVAEELGTELGGVVGYTVRFTDKVGPDTMVKVMTDGILLAEIQRDRMLRRYDTIIIDEAHERSLNVDFLLGYLKQLLPKRPDLKVIVTSATIDTERFAAHFDGAPVIAVEGRTFPVELRYRPIGDDPDDDRDQVQAVCDAIDELAGDGPGDVLVFLSGEREIHDTADAIRRRSLPHTEVLPLYARLSAVEQHRIFQPHTGRRIVLATNVAETSLTVPGVRYVVDTGSARISRYSHRLKVQRLPIEAVSQASANQRAGRCGRVAPGVCIRLFSEDDFAARPEFTEPEILRTNLAAVILQMTALGLGDVEAFPFLEPPESRAIRDGYALLHELGAIVDGRLTATGKKMARLPIDPRLGRMVVEADRHGCVREVMVIAAALSIQDVRERPTEVRQLADESHRRFDTDGSDFMSVVRLWEYLRERQQELNGNQFRKLCRSEYFNYLRVREWRDLYSQLRQIAGGVGIRSGTTEGHPDRIHQSLLAGLLSHIGMRDTAEKGREYRGAFGSKFAIAPGSASSKSAPRWVMAGELVETNRLWARMVAPIQPEWVEQVGEHLVKRSYGDPRWDDGRAGAVSNERVTLFGLPIVTARTVGYDKVDRADARQWFIREALVEGNWRTPHAFMAHNREFLDERAALQERMRRNDLIDDDMVHAFFDAHIGDGVVTGRHFDQWWKKHRGADPEALHLTMEKLTGSSGALDADDFPVVWHQGDLALPVTYVFQPGSPDDGVTVHIPVEVLNRVSSDGFDWQVPGLRRDLVEALVRSLPKAYRKELTPLSATIDAAWQRLPRGIPHGTASLTEALGAALTDLSDIIVPADVFDASSVPHHLAVTFSVHDQSGTALATGTSLPRLRELLNPHVRSALAAASPIDERAGITSWDIGDLPRTVHVQRGGVDVVAYPALVDDGDSVSLRVFTTEAVQARIMRSGVRRLLMLAVPVARKNVERNLTSPMRLALGRLADTNGMTHPIERLLDDCVLAAADALVGPGDVFTADEFDRLVGSAKQQMATLATNAVRDAGTIAVAAASVLTRLDALVAPAVAASAADARAHLLRLTRPGFVTTAGVGRLSDVHRYVQAIDRRLEKVTADLRRDQERMHTVTAVEQRYATWLARLKPSQITAEVIDIGWLLEELRVATFAQSLGTPRPASVQRITRELIALGA